MKLIIISGPPCVGKTTLVRQLLSSFPEITSIQKVTTRQRRESDVDHEMEFVSEEDFNALSEQDVLACIYEIRGNKYGFRKELLDSKEGTHVLIIGGGFHIVEQLKNEYDTRTVFISAPLSDVLSRLSKRDNSSRSDREAAKDILEKYEKYSDLFDITIENVDRDNSWLALRKFVETI